MKAFWIQEIGKTRIGDLAKPVIQPDEVLLKVRMVGFCGSDLNTFRGKNPMVSYPRIPGHEIAATVEATGADVLDFVEIGMNVTVSPYTNCGKCASCRRGRINACQFNETLGVQRDGAMAEYIAVAWQKLYRSDRLTLRELALVEPLTVGFHASHRGEVGGADTVAVFGCGAIGLGAIAGAAFRNATVIAVDIDDVKLDIANKAGAGHTINSSKDNLHARLQELTDGLGPDVIIEAVGLPGTYRAAVEEVAFSGRIVYIGYVKGEVDYETKLFVQKEIDIRGSRNAMGADFKDVISMLENGRFPVDDVVTDVVKLEQAGAALQLWADHPAQITKLMVEF